MTGILRKLQDELGSDLVVAAEPLRDRATSYWDSSPTEAKCLVRPETTEQLSLVMRTCNEHRQSVVVQGGLTGIVQGAASTASDVIVSLERMDVIESVDVADGIAIVQAGVILQTLQEHVADKGFLFPVEPGIWPLSARSPSRM